MTLPIIAYFAAIATNIGTTLALSGATQDERQRGIALLYTGAFGLLFVSGIVVVRRLKRHQRGPWTLLDSWPDLHSEIKARGERLGSGADAEWLSDAWSRFSELTESRSRPRRLAHRARSLLPERIADWETAPMLGIGPYKPATVAFHIPLIIVIRWGFCRPVIAYCLSGSGVAIAIWVPLLAGGDVKTLGGVKYLVFALVAAASGVFASRADLIFHRRLLVRDNCYIRASFTLLRALRPSPSNPRPRMPLRYRQRRR